MLFSHGGTAAFAVIVVPYTATVADWQTGWVSSWQDATDSQRSNHENWGLELSSMQFADRWPTNQLSASSISSLTFTFSANSFYYKYLKSSASFSAGESRFYWGSAFSVPYYMYMVCNVWVIIIMVTNKNIMTGCYCRSHWTVRRQNME